MRKLVITCFLIMIPFVGFSQEKEKPKEKKTTFGITGGFNQNFQTTAPYSFDGLNIYAGFFVEKRLSKRFSLQFELLHTKRHGIGYNTLEFPIFISYNVHKRFNFYAGTQFNLSYINDAYDSNRSNSNEEPGKYAFILGVRYNLSKKGYVDLRYIHNPRKLRFDSGRNNTIRVGVGYRF
ncbi:MAG: porin family protein [Flavobacteriaceae bacterium]